MPGQRQDSGGNGLEEHFCYFSNAAKFIYFKRFENGYYFQNLLFLKVLNLN